MLLKSMGRYLPVYRMLIVWPREEREKGREKYAAWILWHKLSWKVGRADRCISQIRKKKTLALCVWQTSAILCKGRESIKENCKYIDYIWGALWKRTTTVKGVLTWTWLLTMAPGPRMEQISSVRAESKLHKPKELINLLGPVWRACR